MYMYKVVVYHSCLCVCLSVVDQPATASARLMLLTKKKQKNISIPTFILIISQQEINERESERACERAMKISLFFIIVVVVAAIIEILCLFYSLGAFCVYVCSFTLTPLFSSTLSLSHL